MLATQWSRARQANRALTSTLLLPKAIGAVNSVLGRFHARYKRKMHNDIDGITGPKHSPLSASRTAYPYTLLVCMFSKPQVYQRWIPL